MKDHEGDWLEVQVIPYRTQRGFDYVPTICIHMSKPGDLLPLTPKQAVRLARKLAKAAEEMTRDDA